jgi:Uma2 family endonuclease
MPEYWIIDPENETVLTQTLDQERYVAFSDNDKIIRSRHISGLVVDPMDVFALLDWVAEASE